MELMKLNIQQICLYLKWGVRSLSLEACKQILGKALTLLLAPVTGFDQGTFKAPPSSGCLALLTGPWPGSPPTELPQA